MEKALRQYDIHFVGLKSGEHRFNFQINGDFFKLFEQPGFSACDVDVQLIFDKQSAHFVLSFMLEGNVSVDCDRCTAPISYPVFNNYQLYVKYDDQRQENDDTDEVIYISRSESTLNIAQLIYEYINLSLPMVKNCDFLEAQYKNCNQEILKKLNEMGSEEEEKPTPDSRWDGLKKLKLRKK